MKNCRGRNIKVKGNLKQNKFRMVIREKALRRKLKPKQRNQVKLKILKKLLKKFRKKTNVQVHQKSEPRIVQTEKAKETRRKSNDSMHLSDTHVINLKI